MATSLIDGLEGASFGPGVLRNGNRGDHQEGSSYRHGGQCRRKVHKSGTFVELRGSGISGFDQARPIVGGIRLWRDMGRWQPDQPEERKADSAPNGAAGVQLIYLQWFMELTRPPCTFSCTISARIGPDEFSRVWSLEVWSSPPF